MAPPPLPSSLLFARGFETRYTLRSPPRIHRGSRFNFFFAPRVFFPNGSTEEEGEEIERVVAAERDTFLRDDARGATMLLGDLEFRIEMPARTAYVRKPGAKAAARKGRRAPRSWLAPSLSLSLPIYLSIYVFIYLYIYLFIYLFIYVFIYLYIYISIYLSIYIFIYLFIYLFIYISVSIF